MITYTRERLPSPPKEWARWRKVVTTPAIKMQGPFCVETREKTLICEDGWLAIDSEGHPYPIAASEFARIYEPASDTQTIS